MSDFPERIWVTHKEQFSGHVGFRASDLDHSTVTAGYYPEYIRADLMPQWQPIETAPHDVDVILASPPSLTNREWLFEVGAASTGRRFDNGYSSMSFYGHATHWMPIPKVQE